MEDRVLNIHNWTSVYVESTLRLHYEAISWCNQNLGEKWDANENRDGIWTCFWRGFNDGYEFSFKYEEDALLFALRWV